MSLKTVYKLGSEAQLLIPTLSLSDDVPEKIVSFFLVLNKEVEEKGGFELGEMQRKLLEKMEELTLYVIQLSHDNQDLNQQVEKLNTEGLNFREYTIEKTEDISIKALDKNLSSYELNEIDDLPNPWGPFAKAVSFLFVGVGFSGLMSGNILDILVAGGLALIVYLNVYFAHLFSHNNKRKIVKIIKE